MSNELHKIIKINPELFKIPTVGKTKKNIEKKIRIKGSGKTLKNNINNNILNHIRTKQNELFNTIYDSNKIQNTPSDEFQSDFDKALIHMNNLIQKPEKTLNKTIKNKEEIYNIHTSVGLPKYGCLVGGKLPTYRSWKKTSDNTQQPIVNIVNPTTIENINKIKEIQQTANNLNNKKIITNQPAQPINQKRTLKRKYNVGKSKIYSKIGVLISNRTIRTQTIQKTQQINQTSINEIRKILVKKGLIKIGSNAPNDVLRKMYESVFLIVGDVQNHNMETILHNYVHEE